MQCFAGTVRDNRGRCVCPKGTQMSTAGRCEKVNIGGNDCGKGYHRDDNGNCVPDRRVQTQCPDGWHYSKKRLTCVPDKQDQPNVTAPRQPKLQLDPDTMELMQRPQRQKNTGGNLQQSCPKGFVPDGNGGCVPG